MSTRSNNARRQSINRNSSSISPHVRRSKRLSENEVTLKYDAKYHPIDDMIRPANAAKRRRVHGMSPEYDREESWEDDEIGDEEEERGIDEDGSNEQPTRESRGRRNLPGTRHSTRISLQTQICYDFGIHPQDKELRSAGVLSSSAPSEMNTSDTGEEEQEEEEKEDVDTVKQADAVNEEPNDSLPSNQIQALKPTTHSAGCKRKNRRIIQKHSNLANAPGMSVDDYALVCSQAWEATQPAHVVLTFEDQAIAYTSAWETFARQAEFSIEGSPVNLAEGLDEKEDTTLMEHGEQTLLSSLGIGNLELSDSPPPHDTTGASDGESDRTGSIHAVAIAVAVEQYTAETNLTLSRNPPEANDRESLVHEKQKRTIPIAKTDTTTLSQSNKSIKPAHLSSAVQIPAPATSYDPPFPIKPKRTSKKKRNKQPTFEIYEDKPDSIPYWQHMARSAGPVYHSDSGENLKDLNAAASSQYRGSNTQVQQSNRIPNIPPRLSPCLSPRLPPGLTGSGSYNPISTTKHTQQSTPSSRIDIRFAKSGHERADIGPWEGGDDGDEVAASVEQTQQIRYSGDSFNDELDALENSKWELRRMSPEM